MMTLGRTPIGAIDSAVGSSIATPSGYLKWKIELYHRSGGLKKLWHLGQTECPIVSCNFEENLNGSGSCEIVFAYLDFPIDADDYIKIYLYDVIKYSGFAETAPDIKGGSVNFSPWWKRYDEALWTAAYTTKTIAYILEDIVTTLETQTGIEWNASLVDTGSTDTFTIEYNYEKVSKIIEDLLKRTTNRSWGVNASFFFFVQEPSGTENTRLYYGDQPAYSELIYEKEYDNIEYTRLQVNKKVTGTGETTRVGEVGYGGSYPAIELEKTYRIIEDVITVSEVLSDSEALDYAYAKIQAQEIAESIEVKNVQLDKWSPYIGELVNIQDREDLICNTIIECDSTSGWGGSVVLFISLDNTNYVSGTGSIQVTINNLGDTLSYDMTEYRNRPEKINFMMRSDLPGNYFKLNLYYYGYNYSNYSYSSGEYSDNEYSYGGTGEPEVQNLVVSYDLNIAAANTWQLFEFETEKGIVLINRFEITPRDNYETAPYGATINIDRVQLYQLYKPQYTENVCQINYELKKDTENITVNLKSGQSKANKNLFNLDQKIAILESVLDNTV